MAYASQRGGGGEQPEFDGGWSEMAHLSASNCLMISVFVMTTLQVATWVWILELMAPVNLDAGIFITHALARPAVTGIGIRLETIPLIIDPAHLPGRS